MFVCVCVCVCVYAHTHTHHILEYKTHKIYNKISQHIHSMPSRVAHHTYYVTSTHTQHALMRCTSCIGIHTQDMLKIYYITYIHTYTIHTCTYISAYTYIYIHTHTHTAATFSMSHIIYVHTHTHTHTHTHIIE